MARGRMLNKSVSASIKFNLLSDDTCRLLATWTIAQLDKNGVFYGDPAMVKSLIFPRRSDVTIEQVAGYLSEMQQVDLIILFKADSQIWQYWPGFTDNQTGLRADRETSDFPIPSDQPDGIQPGGDTFINNEESNTGEGLEHCRIGTGKEPDNIPPKLIEEEEKLSLNSSSSTSRSEAAEKLTEFYLTYSGEKMNLAMDYINDFLDTYPPWDIVYAINEAIKNSKCSLAYIEAICKRRKAGEPDKPITKGYSDNGHHSGKSKTHEATGAEPTGETGYGSGVISETRAAKLARKRR